ncbi:MAG: GAF domain-containing protein [Leptospirales bacterium]|nr:GAF domain-containing protein [Leptospirales bacterium]HNE22414.1 adenylate/guanylate cyclase domain-containing protein [Leptospiraceae bacterium]
MIPFPTISESPTAWEYFWHQLPWAVTGFLTFVVGVSLAAVGVYAALRRTDKGLLINFVLFSLGYGCLGLVLGFRAVILDRDLLLLLNRIPYFAVVLLSPGGYLFTYYLTDQRYKSLLYAAGAAVVTVVLSIGGLIIGYDFTGEWFHYPFGNFPIAHFPLRLWGLVSALGYLITAVPMTFRYYRDHRADLWEKRYLFIGLHLTSILIISNLPSLAGIPLFPMSSFAFIPLLIMAYGIFHSDFLSVNDLLFQKRGLFKLLAGLVTSGFIIAALATAAEINPTQHIALYLKPTFLIPLFSGVCAFSLAIFLAGSNPDQKLSMLAAASLMLTGAFMVVMTTIKLDLSPVVTRRIEQIMYTFFVFTPSVHMRFAFHSMKQPSPRFVRLFDIAGVISAIVLWTPYFFSGFYEYSFGRISVGGIGLNLYGFVGVVCAATFLFTWWKTSRKEKTPGGLVIFALVVGDLLILLNLPATMGIPLYTLGDLQFIPAFILAFAVLNQGAISVEGEATAIGNRISVLILLFVPVSMLFYFISLAEQGVPALAAISHIALVASPVALAFYMISFVFLRPTALKMDETIRQLAHEKEKTDAALNETERARREIEALSQFTHLINSYTDLDKIFRAISEYVYTQFSISALWLFLPDEKREFLQSYKAYSYNKIPEESYRKLRNLRLPLNENGGIAWAVWERKKSLYLPKIKRYAFGVDREIVALSGATSFLHVPLVVNDRAVGLMAFSNVEENMKLKPREIRTIEAFCAQIAGVVNTAHLLKTTEKQKLDTENLNRFIKSLNEELDMDVIMKKIHEYVKETFQIQYYALYTLDATRSHFESVQIELPPGVSDQDALSIKKITFPVKKGRGANGYALRSKKPFYTPVVENLLSLATPDEQFVVEKCRVRSMILLPLVLNGEAIGVLNLSNSDEEMNLSQEDITRLSILAEHLAGIVFGSNLFQQVRVAKNQADEERGKSERLLLNILPGDVAAELKEKGATEPVLYESVSVMFTDFKGFTQIAETMTPRELIQDLDACFVQFDKITERFNLEKLKTIGDSYMCAGGIPKRNTTHAVDCVLAALEIQAFMNLMRDIKENQGLPYWELRLGIHTGPLVAGVIGEKKFAYDVWGDTVNTASRMESSGVPGRINISGTTYEEVKDLFECEYRGLVNAKNKGEVAMYYVLGIKPEFAQDGDPRAPNAKFWQQYATVT